jgi:hypothetical protein
MKKLLLFGLGVIASLSTLTSCKKDEVVIASPTVTFLNGVKDYTAKESDTAYTFVADIEAAGEISSIKIFEVATDGGENQKESITKFDSDTKHSVKYTVQLANLVTSKKFKITVTDKKDVTTSAVFTITAYTKPAGAINSYTAKLLGAQYASTGSFFAATTGTVYTANDAKTNYDLIDLVYYYGGSTNNATIGSPKDTLIQNAHNKTVGFTTWTKYNETMFKSTTITSSEFDAITDDSKLTALSNFSDSHQNNLAKDRVFAFKTEKGKLGFVKIIAINRNTSAGGTDQNQFQFGSIEIAVKVQK